MTIAQVTFWYQWISVIMQCYSSVLLRKVFLIDNFIFILLLYFSFPGFYP